MKEWVKYSYSVLVSNVRDLELIEESLSFNKNMSLAEVKGSFDTVIELTNNRIIEANVARGDKEGKLLPSTDIMFKRIKDGLDPLSGMEIKGRTIIAGQKQGTQKQRNGTDVGEGFVLRRQR